MVEVASGGQGTGWGWRICPAPAHGPRQITSLCSSFPQKIFLPPINNLPQELELRRVLHARYKPGPAELVRTGLTTPHTLLKKLSPWRGTNLLLFLSSPSTRDVTSKKFSFLTSPQPHHLLWQQVQHHPLPGERASRSCVSHQDKPANKDPGALQPFPCVQGRPPSSLHWLSQGAAPSQGQSSEVGSPACKPLDWIKPKSTSQRVPESRLWDYKG